MEVLNSSVLVLNKFYLPINTISVRRAVSLLFKDCSEVIDEEDAQIKQYSLKDWLSNRRSENRDQIRTVRLSFSVPRIIRLTRCMSMPKYEVKLNKRNVILRDLNTCQYCAKQFPANKLTIDHIIPRSKGGKSVWTNVVTACSQCNLKKGGQLPWEVGMKLMKSPTAPSSNPLISQKMKKKTYKVWSYFLKLDEQN